MSSLSFSVKSDLQLKKISNLMNSADETLLSHTPITKKVGKMFCEKDVCDKKLESKASDETIKHCSPFLL